MTSIQQIFDAALRHHQAGRLQEAQSLYRQILAGQPNHADALHLLGALEGQAGRLNAAVELFARAVAINPGIAEYHVNAGECYRRMGRNDEAIASLQRAIGVNPNHAQAYNILGSAWMDQGQLDQAIACFQRALALQPDFPAACNNLGNACKGNGQIDQAIACYQRALALKPNYAEAHNNLGNVLRSQERLDEAIACFQRALEIKPAYAEAHNNLGNVLWSQERLDEAIVSFQQALRIKPDSAEAHYSLGSVFLKQEQWDSAIAHFRQALEIRPGYGEAYNKLGNALLKKTYIRVARAPDEQFNNTETLNQAIAAFRQAIAINPNLADACGNLAIALRDQLRLREAVAAHEQALRAKPDLPEEHFSYAYTLLLLGDFPRGWVEYEWRWQMKNELTPAKPAKPAWDGAPLNGKTLLIHSEQGFGDMIQFVRYALLIHDRGGKVTLTCVPELFRLMQTCAGIERVTIAVKEDDFDVHCPALSLPRLTGTTLQTIPAQVPYLNADPVLTNTWRGKLVPFDGRKRIGLAWAGSSTHKNDHNRSISLAQLAPLTRSAARFYSLQKGDAAGQAANPPPGMELIDCDRDLNDFADAAALIANLDLVVTVDTAVAHLAGAMGKPVWVMLPYLPDWRWMLDRDDSPWYPTLRLFRQSAPGDWTGVVSRVAEALTRWCS